MSAIGSCGHPPLDASCSKDGILINGIFGVIGRKNFLFSASPAGYTVSALLYSLIETAKANDLEPRAYLNYLFEQLPSVKTLEAVQALLPVDLKMDDLKIKAAIR